MYEKFFGFNEKPFKLVPNPAYLFLSRSHEEALAHLTYAASQGDGFVAVIGEVGTGKTTLCRSFLESLDEQTEAAFIFNPKLDGVRLLKAINDEFGIDSRNDDAKTLIDTLNAFLLDQKAIGKSVILLIDEAQNLSRDVLEQLRLLSNLETTNDKLLQIILVGQPELLDMLESHELRQLGQRIALRSHLEPLAYHETLAYIQHRILIASRKPGIDFSPGAYRRIFRFSKGIPRLINIVCDRSLLIAFGLNKPQISADIVKAAVRELSAGKHTSNSGSLLSTKTAMACGAVIVICLAILVSRFVQTDTADAVFHTEKSSSTAEAPVQKNIRSVSQLPVAPSPPTSVPQAPVEEKRQVVLSEIITQVDPRQSRSDALRQALRLWGLSNESDPQIENMDDNQAYFSTAARQSGLTIERMEADLEQIRNLNLPAILEFSTPEGMANRYFTATRMDGTHISLAAGEKRLDIPLDDLFTSWTGVAYLPWKNFLNLSGNIPIDNSKDAVTAIKLLLRDIGFTDIAVNPFYDRLTREAVESVQRRHGLAVDGVVGSQTKIALYNEWKKFDIPHIVNNSEEAALN